MSRTPTTHADEPLLLPGEVATQLRVSVKTLENWRGLHIGPPAFKVSGRVRYRRSEVIRWLAEQESVDPRGAA